MYGCNNYCTYCIVPYVRGNERSRDAKEIIMECEKLASEGVKEVMLLGQNVNSYGNGIPGSISFPQLLREVEKIDGIKRIRFMTSHPKDLSDELIEVMKESVKICRHIHLPLQSGSSRILKAMNRRYDKEKYLDLALKIRRELPDTSITTDIIVGFPGETTEDVDDTIDVIRKVRFDGAFTFIYSPRTGTPAASMEGRQSSEWIKREFDRVLSAVQDESKRMAERFLTNTESVLVEGMNEQDDSLVTGRMGNNLMVHFPGDRSLIGQIVDVKLTECRGFYYMGEMVNSN
jgi:tRNA-2-methylthio-N6-dimethylallyladenosine synthase